MRVARVRIISLAAAGEQREQVPQSCAWQPKKPAVCDCPNEHPIRDVEQNFDLAKELPGNRLPKENFLIAVVFCHAQLPFQHDVEKVGGVAIAKKRLPGLDANLSSR